jgi:hypothetical protein
MKHFNLASYRERPRNACEALCLQRIPKSLQLLEADLYSAKWFDYRLLHPIQATDLFAHYYVSAARLYCEIAHDRDKAQTLRVLGDPDPFKTREAIALHVARQHYDRIGCRYEWAFQFIVKRFTDRGWAAMPRPNQLYGEELLLDVADGWKELCEISLQTPRSKHFQHCTEPLQTAQQEFALWIAAQARTRGHMAFGTCSRLIKEGFLSEAAVEREFGTDTLKKALAVLGK